MAWQDVITSSKSVWPCHQTTTPLTKTSGLLWPATQPDTAFSHLTAAEVTVTLPSHYRHINNLNLGGF
jgi:hypothetical protein